MITKKRCAFSFLSFFSPFLVQADIIGYQFHSIESHTQQTIEQRHWVDPQAVLDVYLAGGLERYVELTLFKDKQELYHYISPLLSESSDMIFQGQNFYGAVAQIPKNKLESCLCTLQFKLLDSSKQVIRQTSKLIRINTTSHIDKSPLPPEMVWKAENLNRKTQNDFLFAIDVSGSMDGQIYSLKNSIISFADKLLKAGGDNRYAGLGVSDPFINAKGKFNSKFDFSKDQNAFKNWVGDIQTTGGDEHPYVAARWGIQNMQWREDANQYVILISDEPPHDDASVLNDALMGQNVFIFSRDGSYAAADAQFIQQNFTDQSLLKEVIGKHRPLINQIEVKHGQITVHVIDAFIGEDTTGVHWDVDTAYLELKNKDNRRYQLGVSAIRFIDGTYYLDFDALNQSHFIDGLYEVKVFVKDNLKNEVNARLGEFTIDTTAPDVTVLKEGDVFSQGVLQHFEDLKIQVTDKSDIKQATVTAVISGGPEKVARYLETKFEDGHFKVLPPALFQSKEDLDYQLKLSVADSYGNTTHQTLALTYQPEVIRPQEGVDNALQLPAVPGHFKYADALEVLHTAPIQVDGLPLEGEYTVQLFSSPQSEVSLRVGEKALKPNESISFKYNFDAHGGRFNIPISAHETGKVGLAKLVALIHAPNAPIIEADIHFWNAKAHLNAQSWQVRQVIDPVEVQATPTQDTLCRFTTDVDKARASDMIRDPVCLLTWKSIPDEAEALVKDALPTLKGQAFKLGTQKVAYTLSIFDFEGQKIQIGQGTHDLNVLSAKGALKYTTAKPIEKAHHIVDAQDIWLKRLEGFECALTLRQDEALEPDSCLLEWTHIPDGLVQQQGTSEPLLKGHMMRKGLNNMNWRISTFSKSGAKVTLAEQHYPIQVVEPDSPQLTVISDYHWKDNIYLVPYDASSVGEVQVKALKAPLNLKRFQEDKLLDSEDYAGLSYAYDDLMTIRALLGIADKPLWEKQKLQVRAQYIELPSVQSEHEVTVIRVTSENIEPVFVDPPRQVLTTEDLSVTVTMRKHGEDYHPQTMGQWQVRLLQEEAYRDYSPLTEFKPLEAGQVTFDIDVSERAGSHLSMLAEAKLVHELDGYERLERSHYPKTVLIKKGSEITGQIVTKYPASRAPYDARLYVDLTDNDDTYSLEQVLWEQSHDQGQTWTLIDDRVHMSLAQRFEAGMHLVRATFMNKYSGASYTTSPLEILAYPQPEIYIEGPDMDFVGSEVELTASLSLHKKPVENMDDYVIEWSKDGGRTYKPQASMIISSHEAETLKVYARVRSSMAPEDDDNAYDVTSKRVSFIDVRPPQLSIEAPRKMEFGQAYTWSVESKVPYRLDYDVEGFFTLPSGEQKHQHVLQYTPTEADVQRTYVDLNFTAWLKSYRTLSENQASQRIYVWKYEWPEFKLSLEQNTDTAPASFDVRVRQKGYSNVDGLRVDWRLPEGAIDIEKTGLKNRSFTMDKSGHYQVSAVVRDERGHETVLNEDFALKAAAPFQMGFKTKFSNEMHFAPLEVKIYPDVTGGHPRDRIIDIEIYIDGELLERHYGFLKKNFDAGEHRVKFVAHSKMGHSIAHEEIIHVVQNQVPVCEPTLEELERYWVVHPNCTDSDGKVRRYHWTLDDEPPFKQRGSLELSKRYYPNLPHISFQAEDDFYDKSQVYVVER